MRLENPEKLLALLDEPPPRAGLRSLVGLIRAKPREVGPLVEGVFVLPIAVRINNLNRSR